MILTVVKNEIIRDNRLSVSSLSNGFDLVGNKIVNITITNSFLYTVNVDLQALSEYSHNCPSTLLARRSCSVKYPFNAADFKQGYQVKSLNILNNPLQVSFTVVKPECSANLRISSSKCDQANNDQFMSKNLVDLSEYPNAICNDGSPAAFFKRPGVGSGAKRWVIHLEEGGFCGEFPLSLGNFLLYFNVCPLRRQQTPQYTSTLYDGPAYKYNNGILGGTEQANPDFYSWNHVEIRYCSSDIWSGNNQQTIANEPYVWKFKGTSIIDAVFNTLKEEHDLGEAQNIILSGSSAGGFGILAQGDYIKENHLIGKDVSLLSDSSWVQDYNDLNGRNFFDLLFKKNLPYLNGRTDASCSSRLGINDYRCFLGLEAYSDISTPIFIIQDQLDSFYLNLGFGVTSVCSTSITQQNLMSGIANQLRLQLANKTGVVSPRSFSHVFLTSNRWINPELLDGQQSIKDIFSNWYFNKTGSKSFISDPANLNQEISDYCN